MPEINSMTLQLLLWLFSGITAFHLIGAALVWLAVFIPGKLGFKEDSMLKICIWIYLACEFVVTLFYPGEDLSMILTMAAGAALFFGIGRLVRWLVFHLKDKKSTKNKKIKRL